jgi:hypothetical protein
MTFDKEWHQLPRPAAMTRLIEIRNELRQKNLYDTEEPPLERPDKPEVPPAARTGRMEDGTFNDLACPFMGATGTRFGRNVPLQETFPDTANLLAPNPRTVSLELFTRTQFQPATILNVLAAAWIQFQVHDWFVHEKGIWTNTHDIPIADTDTWPEKPMRVPKTPADPAKVAGSTRAPAYANLNSHWWDGSQVYGSDRAVMASLRTGSKGTIRIGPDGRTLFDPDTELEITGFKENGWVALSLLHGLFAMEHNAICERLAHDFPSWDDERLFQQARLINAALMAKIHTVEWTPAVVPHPIIRLAMNTNWRGLAGKLQDAFTGLNDSELLGGIPGSPTDHHSAPYSLTEEFAAVYRMHSLIPDDYTIRSVKNGAVLGQFELPALSGRKGRTVLEQFDCADLLYSFGVAHPGALRLRNFPKHLQHMVKDNGEHFDLCAVDILRDRERGVPRYNRFRRLFHKEPVKTFEELTDIPQLAADIKRVYGGDLESVDLLTGLMCEPLPEGFGFSDTAFRVFVLMASRRLKSDRFLSKDYGPDVYTKLGIDWIEQTTMIDVLTRHFPAVAPALSGVTNAFQPWKQVS